MENFAIEIENLTIECMGAPLPGYSNQSEIKAALIAACRIREKNALNFHAAMLRAAVY